MAGVAVATPTFPVPHQHFAILSLLATPTLGLLVNHIMFWPHQLWKPPSAHGPVGLRGSSLGHRGQRVLSRAERASLGSRGPFL